MLGLSTFNNYMCLLDLRELPAVHYRVNLIEVDHTFFLKQAFYIYKSPCVRVCVLTSCMYSRYLRVCEWYGIKRNPKTHKIYNTAHLADFPIGNIGSQTFNMHPHTLVCYHIFKQRPWEMVL